MLMQNFKTAAELRVQAWEWDGLIKVLGMLEREEFTRGEETNIVKTPYRATSAMSFHMACPGRITHCGTVACIGGWVAILAGENFMNYIYYSHSPVLSGLYWPEDEHLNATSEQSAAALRSFLTTGDPHWAEAMAG